MCAAGWAHTSPRAGTATGHRSPPVPSGCSRLWFLISMACFLKSGFLGNLFNIMIYKVLSLQKNKKQINTTTCRTTMAIITHAGLRSKDYGLLILHSWRDRFSEQTFPDRNRSVHGVNSLVASHGGRLSSSSDSRNPDSPGIRRMPAPTSVAHSDNPAPVAVPG